MIQRNRSLSAITMALVAAFGLWALPAQAGHRSHSGVSFSVSYGSRCGTSAFYGYGHSRPYYGHSRYYRPYRGSCYYPRHSYRYRSYGYRGRGYRNRCYRW